jgi:hypothetical protein
MEVVNEDQKQKQTDILVLQIKDAEQRISEEQDLVAELKFELFNSYDVIDHACKKVNPCGYRRIGIFKSMGNSIF